MRALSGAIITAAALIGLGLTAQGIGTRYQQFYEYKPAGEDEKSPALKRPYDWEASQVKFGYLDNPMKLAVAVTTGCVLIGLAITFIGLMYHHHRRHHEHLHRMREAAGGQPPRVTV